MQQRLSNGALPTLKSVKSRREKTAVVGVKPILAQLPLLIASTEDFQNLRGLSQDTVNAALARRQVETCI